MAFAVQGFRLGVLPRATRVVITCFVALVGIGYLISLVHLYFTYAMADGKPALTAQDVKLSLYGKRDSTLLEQKISPGGSMAQYLTDPAEREAIVRWIRGGAREERFASVQPIFQKNCVRCHNPNGQASFRPLTDYQKVKAVAAVQEGESFPAWARVAHTHLLSLSMLFLLLGGLFSFCGFPEKLKIGLVATPYVTLVTDFASRALVRFWPEMVHVTMLSGGVMALATVAMIAGTLYELWLWRPNADAGTAPAAPEPSRAELEPAGA